MPIPYGRQSIDEADIAAVDEVLRGDWLTQGPHVEAFERAVAERVGAPHAVAFSSGTAALHGAAFAAGLGPGDELLTSAMTFAASANCGAYLGATPRFADIDRSTWNVSAGTIAAATTAATRAVVPVHFTGLPAAVAEIREVVGDDVVVIEDAAQALGARTEDEVVGSCKHSDMAVFSFHPVKTVTSAEGGVVTTRDPELRDRMMGFRTHGMVRERDRLREADHGGWYHEQQELGFNYRLSDVHSALGRSQMSKVDRFITARNAIAARYREWLGDLGALELPPEPPPGATHARHLFVIRHRDGSQARRSLYDGLREREIFCQVHYLPVHLHPYYRDNYGYGPGDFPEAEDYYAGCLSLPCFPDLGEDDQRRVADAIRELVG
jgi:UDP-4-amino-4,6-dideoxy-N-acetyl-beta-L-altrosamine transaminase